MIHDSLPLTDTISKKSLLNYISFLEKYFNAEFLVDIKNIPYGREDLVDLFAIAKKLFDAGVINKYGPVPPLSDEPLRNHWFVQCADQSKSTAGGMSFTNDYDALIAALAESLERYLWFEEIDFLQNPIQSSTEEMIRRKRAIINPLSIVGLSQEHRSKCKGMSISSETKFLWTKGYSWTKNKRVYLPAQLVSARKNKVFEGEPYIHIPITTGLATWSTKKGAVLSGALEVIERDAFMITWLNQISLPQLNIAELTKKNKSLQKLIEVGAKYGLTFSAVRMPTDAPTYTVCGSVKDVRKNIPEMTIGLKAGPNLAVCVEGALLEALRMRLHTRKRNVVKNSWDETKDLQSINHLERCLYWAEPKFVSGMYFLAGSDTVENNPSEAWDADSQEEHLERIVAWAKNNGYEMASVSLGKSKKNVSPWSVEMVIMPEMQPMHQHEKHPYTAGKRLSEIPEKFGYQPAQVYPSVPHPFA